MGFNLSDFLDWQDAFKDKILNSIHKFKPAKIISYDHTTNKATVQILTKSKDVNGKISAPPNLQGVPVWNLRTGDFFVHSPIKQEILGEDPTLGMLLFMDDCLDEYKGFGGSYLPVMQSKHDINHAVFIAGFYPFSKAIPDINNDDLIIGSDNSAFRLNATKTGGFTVKNPLASLEMNDQGKFGLKNALSALGIDPVGDFNFTNEFGNFAVGSDGAFSVGNQAGTLEISKEGDFSLRNDYAKLELEHNGDIQLGLSDDSLRLEFSPQRQQVSLGGGGFSLIYDIPTVSLLLGNENLSVGVSASTGIMLKTDVASFSLPIKNGSPNQKAEITSTDPENPIEGLTLDGNEIPHTGNASQLGFVTQTNNFSPIYSNITAIPSTSIVLIPTSNIYTKTVASNTTFTIDASSLNATNKAITFEVHVTMASAYTVAFTGVTFIDVPMVNSAGTYVFVIRSTNGGSSWIGNLAYKI